MYPPLTIVLRCNTAPKSLLSRRFGPAPINKSEGGGRSAESRQAGGQAGGQAGRQTVRWGWGTPPPSSCVLELLLRLMLEISQKRDQMHI